MQKETQAPGADKLFPNMTVYEVLITVEYIRRYSLNSSGFIIFKCSLKSDFLSQQLQKHDMYLNFIY